MARWLLAALTLLASPSFARAEVRLDVVGDPSDREFDLTASVGSQTQHCTLPAPGGCSLSLSPGPLHLRVLSGGHARELDEMVPDTRSELLLGYRSAGMGYTGLGLLAGGLAFTGLTIGLGVSARNNNANFGVDILAAFGMVITGLISAGLYIAGGVLTGVGFARAGPTLDFSVPEGVTPTPAPPPPSWSTGAPST